MPPSRLPQKRGPSTALSVQEKQSLIAQFRALPQREHAFVAEMARQAQQARGRIDDDVYGIIRVTLQALRETGGEPPPLIFAVTHHHTGEVAQVGFLPTGVRQILPGGRFVTNDPRFGPHRRLPEGGRPQLEA